MPHCLRCAAQNAPQLHQGGWSLEMLVGTPTSEAKKRGSEVSVELEERAVTNPKVKRATGTAYYSALVAIGASYTDNAHARDAQYAGSLRQYHPYDKYGGRYSNGPVAVEYMVQSGISPALKQQRGGVKLLDYAYGGSVVQNGSRLTVLF